MAIQIIKDLDGVRALVHKLQQHPVIGFDLETTGLSPIYDKILLVSFATSRDDMYVIDCTLTGVNDTFTILAPLLTNERIIKLGFNFTFDWKMTFGATKIEINNMFDCMVADQMLTAGLFVEGLKGKQFSLEAVAHRRLGVPMNKQIRNIFIGYTGTGFNQEEYEYAAYDTGLLFPIYEQQLEEIAKHELGRVCELEMNLLPVTSLMEYTGVRVDVEKLKTLVEPFTRYVDTCYRALQDAFIEYGAADHILFDGAQYTAVNPASKPINRKDKQGNKIYTKGQMLTALEQLGINPRSLRAKDIVQWDFRNSGRHIELNYSDLVEDDEIANALDKYGGLENPILRLYAFYLGADKLVNTYVIKELERIDLKTNRRYGWYNQLGARSTGRYSSNMQQTPQNNKLARLGLGQYSIRECYTASPNSVLLIADYSAIEAVIIADQSGDKRLAHEHTHGDLHIVVAHDTIGHFYPFVKELNKENRDKRPFKLFRQAAKRVTYGIAYGIHGKSLSEQMTIDLAGTGIAISPEQGDIIKDLWLNQTFPQAGKYLQSNAINAVTLGYVKSALGRKRFFDLPYLEEEVKQAKVKGTQPWKYLAAQREGSNAPIQGTSADMVKLAMWKIYTMLDKRYGRIIITVHDELVIEASKKYAKEAACIMKFGMEWAAQQVLPLLGHTVIVDVHESDCYDK